MTDDEYRKRWRASFTAAAPALTDAEIDQIRERAFVAGFIQASHRNLSADQILDARAIAKRYAASYHPAPLTGIVRAASPVDAAPVFDECGDCDGCGWNEGGPAIVTECATCNGTGRVSRATPSAGSGVPSSVVLAVDPSWSSPAPAVAPPSVPSRDAGGADR